MNPDKPNNRHKAYIQRQLEAGSMRLTILLDKPASDALKRICKQTGDSMQGAIKKAIIALWGNKEK